MFDSNCFHAERWNNIHLTYSLRRLGKPNNTVFSVNGMVTELDIIAGVYTS